VVCVCGEIYMTPKLYGDSGTLRYICPDSNRFFFSSEMRRF
jgi:hypothetical protein